jgi:HlyD family secretion protein
MKATIQPQNGASTSAQPISAVPVRRRRRSSLVWGVLALVVVAIAAVLIVRLRAGKAVTYVTAPVVRTTLVQTVTAEGTVNPQNLILVGTQVSGTISELDVDYNSAVRVGQVMAKIDPTTFRDALDSAAASRTQYGNQYAAGVAAAQSAAQTVATDQQNAVAARAALASSAAQVGKAKTAAALAALTVQRDAALLTHGYVAQNQYDTDASTRVAAQAALTAAQLAVDQARAQAAAQDAVVTAGKAQARSASATARADQAQIGVYGAQVAIATYNLRQSVIVSPVRGTVIARNVSVGQTVAASFTTPTLFTIAQDLTKMEVDIAAGEPDVGGVHTGEAADFTVLAFPNRTFTGTVYQVRQNPTTLNNVVTYDTVVYVQNRDGALFPGMTANANIHVAKVANALVVPLQALGWAPRLATTAASESGAAPASPWGTTTASLSRTVVAGRNGRLFVLENNVPRAVSVRILLVSGTQAAVAPIAGLLGTTDRIVISDSSQNTATKATSTITALAPAATAARPATH